MIRPYFVPDSESARLPRIPSCRARYSRSHQEVVGTGRLVAPEVAAADLVVAPEVVEAGLVVALEVFETGRFAALDSPTQEAVAAAEAGTNYLSGLLWALAEDMC